MHHPLYQFIKQRQAQSVLYIDEQGSLFKALKSIKELGTLHQIGFDELERLQKTEAHELVIVDKGLTNVDKKKAHQLLAELRNRGHRSILLIIESCYEWPLQDYLGLGFSKSYAFSFQNIAYQSYIYELSHYNFKRAWNNARFWANPENFHRFRW